jgi:hypothetical protein
MNYMVGQKVYVIYNNNKRGYWMPSIIMECALRDGQSSYRVRAQFAPNKEVWERSERWVHEKSIAIKRNGGHDGH